MSCFSSLAKTQPKNSEFHFHLMTLIYLAFLCLFSWSQKWGRLIVRVQESHKICRAATACFLNLFSLAAVFNKIQDWCNQESLPKYYLQWKLPAASCLLPIYVFCNQGKLFQTLVCRTTHLKRLVNWRES